MSALIFTVEQKDCFERAEFLELQNIFPNLSDLIEVRKRYITEFKKTNDEQRIHGCIAGFNYCNAQILNLLSIPLTQPK